MGSKGSMGHTWDQNGGRVKETNGIEWVKGAHMGSNEGWVETHGIEWRQGGIHGIKMG